MESPDLDHMKRIAGLSGEDALLFLWVFVEFWGEGWDNRRCRGDVGERTGASREHHGERVEIWKNFL